MNCLLHMLGCFVFLFVLSNCLIEGPKVGLRMGDSNLNLVTVACAFSGAE